MTTDFSYKYLLCELDDGVLTLTLNRPDRLNAMSHEMHYEVEDFIERVESIHEARVVVITGAGRGFCAGGDVSGDIEPDPLKRIYGRDAIFGYIPSRGHISRLTRSMIESSKPIIAAVNGPAAGSGATLALLCDVVFMADTARIGDRHTRMGLAAGDGGAFLWPALIGLNRAKEVLLSGAMLTSEEAYRLGLVNHVAPGDQLMESAMTYARRLAALPELGVRTTKIACNKLLQLYYNNAGDMSVEFYARTASDTAIEAAAQEFKDQGRRA